MANNVNSFPRLRTESQLDLYSRARLICTATARKNHANYPSMRIIRAYFMLSNITLWKVVSWTTMRIIRGMRISEGQIIRATLYLNL